MGSKGALSVGAVPETGSRRELPFCLGYLSAEAIQGTSEVFILADFNG